MDRQAWFCPGCQKHHAPHVETCPAPVDAVGRPAPAHWPRYETGLPDTSPISPTLYPWAGTPQPLKSYGIIVKPDPNHQIQN